TAPLQAQTLPAQRDTLVVLLRNPFKTLDPAGSNDLGGMEITGNIYESLISFDRSPDSFKTWLASAVPTRENGLESADGTEFTFPLRRGVRFHDGSVMTPEDVRYSFFREIF